jgi:putative transposase
VFDDGGTSERLLRVEAATRLERSDNDQHVGALISQCCEAGKLMYGYRKIRNDLHDLSETCGKHRMARLMRLSGLRSHTGDERHPGRYGGRPAVVAPHLPERQRAPTVPNMSWVTDITYILKTSSKSPPVIEPVKLVMVVS